MSLKSYLLVLKNIDFTKLWISQACSQLTNYILSFAILIRVFQTTDSSTSVSIVIIVFGLGTVFFGSIAGVYADRFNRKSLLTAINFAQAISIGLYFIIGSNFWALISIVFLYSALNQFYIPAEAPTIPDLVPKDQILIANSYFAFTGSAALIIGFALAGPLTIVLGQKGPFLAGVLLLIIAGLATLTLPSLPPLIKQDNPFSLNKVWQEFKEGVDHFWENKHLHFPLLSLVAIQIVNGMMITVTPAFISDYVGINLEKNSLLIVAPLGLGVLVGALSLGLEEHRFKKKDLIFAGFIGMGLMLVFLSAINFFPQRYIYYALVSFIMGIFNAHIFAPSHSIMQTHALAHVRGRIYGSLYLLLQVAATLPTILAGVLADKIRLSFVIAGLGGLLIIFGILLDKFLGSSKIQM